MNFGSTKPRLRLIHNGKWQCTGKWFSTVAGTPYDAHDAWRALYELLQARRGTLFGNDAAKAGQQALDKRKNDRRITPW